MANRVDPYTGYQFRVEIDSITRAGFQECSGLNTTLDVKEYREGNDSNTVRKLAGGLISYNNITLSRGITNDSELWEWHKNCLDGTMDRRNVSIVLMNNGSDVIRWNVRNAWPTTWTGPDLNATSDDVVVEQLELVHEGYEVDTWS